MSWWKGLVQALVEAAAAWGVGKLGEKAPPTPSTPPSPAKRYGKHINPT